MHKPITAALLALASLSVCAQNGASVLFSNITITLTDLDPNDGIAPSYGGGDPRYIGSWVIDVTGPVIPPVSNQFLGPVVGTAGLGKIGHDFIGTSAPPPDAKSEQYPSAYTLDHGYLSANTAMTISGNVRLATTGQAEAGFDLRWADYPFTPDTTGLSDEIRLSIHGTSFQSRALGLTFSNTTGASHALYWDIDAGTYIGAVPEPETYALVAAGLGLLGWKVRRSTRPPQPRGR